MTRWCCHDNKCHCGHQCLICFCLLFGRWAIHSYNNTTELWKGVSVNSSVVWRLAYSLYVRRCVCVYLCVFAILCLCECGFMHFVFVRLCDYSRILFCSCVCVFVWLCICIFVCLIKDVFVWIWMNVFACVWVKEIYVCERKKVVP